MLDSQILSEALKARSQNNGIAGAMGGTMGGSELTPSAIAGQGGQQTQTSPILSELIKKLIAGGAG